MASDNFAFLVVGAGRGGTSLLAGLLDYHERLEVGFEQFAEGYLVGTALPVTGAAIFETRVTAFLEACRAEARRFPDKFWGNKITTEQIFGLEDHNAANPGAAVDVLDAFFNVHLKDQKVVFILRDGRTCVRSKVARTGQSVELACERWRYSVRVHRFLRSRRDSIGVTFEDLLLHPARTLGDICAFLGVPFQESMLEGTHNAKMLADYRQARLDLAPLALDGIPVGCVERIDEDLKLCGYV